MVAASSVISPSPPPWAVPCIFIYSSAGAAGAVILT